jgi:hypothetical protein
MTDPVDIERRSRLEQNGVFTLKEYQDHIQRKLGFRPTQVGNIDRGCVSPLAGLAKPDPRWPRFGKPK